MIYVNDLKNLYYIYICMCIIMVCPEMVNTGQWLSHDLSQPFAARNEKELMSARMHA